MKKIYLVRHGQSEVNAGKVRDSFDSPLTDKGLDQADKIADRLSNLDFDLIISSTLKRAQQTAEAIAKKTNKEITTSDLFVERKRPNEQLGESRDSSITIMSEEMSDKAFLSNEKYKESESFKEITDRAKQALDLLENREENNIVVVTHGMFMRVLFAYIILQDSINPENCMKFIENLKTKNTGVTVIEKKNDKWSLLTWNDHSHFAE